MLVCHCPNRNTSDCARCLYSNLHLGDVSPMPSDSEDQLEIRRLKELLFTIKNLAIVDFNSTYERLAALGLEDNFSIPESRLREILESL